MKVSKLYGQPVLGKNKKTHGYVMGIRCAENTIKYLICCDGSERVFYADFKGCRLEEGGVVFEKKIKTADGKEGGFDLLLGRAAYSDQGKYLGTLADCTVKGSKIISARIGRKSYPAERLIFGDAVLLKSDELAAKNLFISALLGE